MDGGVRSEWPLPDAASGAGGGEGNGGEGNPGQGGADLDAGGKGGALLGTGDGAPDGAQYEDAAAPDSGDAAVDASSCDASASPLTTPCLIDEAYGVFVAPYGADSNDGSRAHPLATIDAGLAAAARDQRNLYVCATEGAYDEPVALGPSHAGMRLFGGFGCTQRTQWTYSATARASVRAAPPEIPLTIMDIPRSLMIVDFDFIASAASAPGQSSIAAFVRGSSNVQLERVGLHSGSGADGSSAPATPSNVRETTTLDGNPADPAGGGAENGCLTQCSVNPGMSYSWGGKGGSVPDGSGEPGFPEYADTRTGDGSGGAAAGGGAQCTDGHRGADAPFASGGQGASDHGWLSATGWLRADGTAGATGGVGQGGGGGGAGTAVSSGGGGGACGGCGGTGGGAGQGAGSSFALLSYQAVVAFANCQLSTGVGGKGGNGGQGEPGQSGGHGGVQSGGGCKGGNGGTGGAGGHGGGGAGGLSVGIGYVGIAPSLDANTTISVGTVSASNGGAPGQDPGAGSAGSPDASADFGNDAGANSASNATKGVDGIAQSVLELSSR